MPEPSFLYSFMSLEPPKKSPIIKMSGGIGDTDGFPAFDVDSDAYAVKDNSKWGFLFTGGAEFHMPLTVFQVIACRAQLPVTFRHHLPIQCLLTLLIGAHLLSLMNQNFPFFSPFNLSLIFLYVCMFLTYIFACLYVCCH